MKTAYFSVAASFAAATMLAASAAQAAPAVGKPAPAFSAVDADGKTRSLAEFRGKTVVLEWVNEGCPYVKKHYGSGSMQTTQKNAVGQGAVWLAVASSAPGQQGYMDATRAKAWRTEQKAGPNAVLLDPKGTIGRLYGAQTTPHMYVIDPKGNVAYMGAIDDKPSSDASTLKGAKNYVLAALADVKAGRPVAQAVTKPYGCSVKYQ
jgi:hypothetical protein